jgi:hypothetical protein
MPYLAEYLGAALIYLLGRSLRITWVGLERRDAVAGPVVYAFWHARMLILAFTHRWRHIRIMISESRDGEYIARPVSRLGFVPIRGSSSRSGLRALVQMVQQAKAGHDCAVTPDGPRGPREAFQGGALGIAQRSGVPIVPIAAAAERCWRLNSWDRFVIPKPFSRAVVVLGEPVDVPKHLNAQEREALRLDLEARLVAVTRQAEKWFAPAARSDKG